MIWKHITLQVSGRWILQIMRLHVLWRSTGINHRPDGIHPIRVVIKITIRITSPSSTSSPSFSPTKLKILFHFNYSIFLYKWKHACCYFWWVFMSYFASDMHQIERLQVWLFKTPLSIFSGSSFGLESASNKVHQNVWLHVSFLIFYGSLIGHIILLPPEVVLWLVTKILFPAEVVLCSQSEYQRIWEMVSFWWTSFSGNLCPRLGLCFPIRFAPQ